MWENEHFFLHLKCSPENCVPRSPSLKKFFSSKCFQRGNIQIIMEANTYWELTMCRALCQVVYLNLMLFSHQPEEVGIIIFPIFRGRNPCAKRWGLSLWATKLMSEKACFLTLAKLSPKSVNLQHTEKLIFVDYLTVLLTVLQSF